MFRRALALSLTLGMGCGGGDAPEGDPDAGICALADAGVVPLGVEICDGLDNDCNGTVDDAPSALGQTVYPDADGDGYGDSRYPIPDTCPSPGFVAVGPGDLFDCDDRSPYVSPAYPTTCDFDGDSFNGAFDCDDHDPAVYPGAIEVCNGVDDDCDKLVDDADQNGAHPAENQYSKDEDGDGYPSAVVFACTPPGNGFVTGAEIRAIDCAPDDAAIHPAQPDDCATHTDTNCDGVFRPVYISQIGPPTINGNAGADLFTRAGPTDPPTYIGFAGDGRTTMVDVCPGTYRVNLLIGMWGPGIVPSTIIFRGRGATPADVVFDAGGVMANAWVVPVFYGDDYYGDVDARFVNLTLANGAEANSSAGCIIQTQHSESHADVTLENVVLRDCAADRGGAIAVAGGNALTLIDTSFVRTTASVSGGAIEFAGRALTMTGGGFVDISAPAGSGTAIAAHLSGTSTLDLLGVDLGSVADDIVVTFPSGSVVRDLGTNATLHCDVASGCTP